MLVAVLSFKGEIKWCYNMTHKHIMRRLNSFNDSEVRALEYHGEMKITLGHDWIMSIHHDDKLAGAVDIYETKDSIQFVDIISTKLLTLFTKIMLNAILLYAQSRESIKFIFPTTPYYHTIDLLKQYGAASVHYKVMHELVDVLIDFEHYEEQDDVKEIVFFPVSIGQLEGKNKILDFGCYSYLKTE